MDPDTQGFTSHLPIILIHTFESGTLDAYGTDHVPAAIQVLEPTSGTSRLVGRAALDARSAFTSAARAREVPEEAIRARAARRRRRRGQRLASARAAQRLRLGAVRPGRLRRSLIRNALAFALSNRIGRYAPRTRFAEVFMVDDGGDVRAESFLGFFTLIEKIARVPSA